MTDAEKLEEIRKTAEASIARLSWGDEDDEDEDEDDAVDIGDRCGGNFDDAYRKGEEDEELRMARCIMGILRR